MPVLLDPKRFVLSSSQFSLREWLMCLPHNQTPNGKCVFVENIDSVPTITNLFFTLNKNTNLYTSVAKYVGKKPTILEGYPQLITVNGREGYDIPCQIEESIIYQKPVGVYDNSKTATVKVILSKMQKVLILNDIDLERERKEKESLYKTILLEEKYSLEQAEAILTVGKERSIDALKWVNFAKYEDPENQWEIKRVLDGIFSSPDPITQEAVCACFTLNCLPELPPIGSFLDLLHFLSATHEILQYMTEMQSG
jgi:hypothetical protein